MKTTILTIILALTISNVYCFPKNKNVFKIGINKVSYLTAFYIKDTDLIVTALHGLLERDIVYSTKLEIELFDCNQNRYELIDPLISMNFDKDLLIIKVDLDLIDKLVGFEVIQVESLNKLQTVAFQGSSLLQSYDELSFHEINTLALDNNNITNSIPSALGKVIFLGGTVVDGFSGAPVCDGLNVCGFVSGSNYENKIFAIQLLQNDIDNALFQKFKEYRNDLYFKSSNSVLKNLLVYESIYGKIYNLLRRKIECGSETIYGFDTFLDTTNTTQLRNFLSVIETNNKLLRISKNENKWIYTLKKSTNAFIEGNYDEFFNCYIELVQEDKNQEKQNALFRQHEISVFRKNNVDLSQIKKILSVHFANIQNANYLIKNEVFKEFASKNYYDALQLFIRYKNLLEYFSNPESLFQIYKECYSVLFQSNNVEKNIPRDKKRNFEVVDTCYVKIFPESIETYYHFLNPLEQKSILGNEDECGETNTEKMALVPVWYKNRDIKSLMNFLAAVLPYGKMDKKLMDKYPRTITFLNNIRFFLIQYQNNYIESHELIRLYNSFNAISEVMNLKDSLDEDFKLWKSQKLNFAKENEVNRNFIYECLQNHSEEIKMVCDTIQVKPNIDEIFENISKYVSKANKIINSDFVLPDGKINALKIRDDIQLSIDIGVGDKIKTEVSLLNYGLGEYELMNVRLYEFIVSVIKNVENIILEQYGVIPESKISLLGSSDAIPFKNEMNRKLVDLRFGNLDSEKINLLNGQLMDFSIAIRHKNLNNYALAFLRAYTLKTELSNYLNFDNANIWAIVSNHEGDSYRKVKLIITYKI